MGQNFRGFRGLTNIRKNFIRELGVLAVLLRDSGQICENFICEFSFLEPSAKILSHENFLLYGTIQVTRQVSLLGLITGEHGRELVSTILLHIICCIELCVYLQYKLSIIHHARIQDSCILPRCAVADKVLIDYLRLCPR